MLSKEDNGSKFYSLIYHGGDSRGLNERVHENSCRYSEKIIFPLIPTRLLCNKMHLLIIPGNYLSKCFFFLQCVVIFSRSPSKVEILKTIFVRTCVENYCILWSNF